jgi:chromosome partitioning protein
MRTIAVTNYKGGSAKTTTVVNLAAALGELGHRVLVIDIDPQGSASAWLGVDGAIDGVAEAIAGRIPLSELLYETTAPGVMLVPASPSIVVADPQQETQIALGFMRAMDRLPALWDVVVIDCPPTLGYLAIAPLSVCQEVLIPVEARVLAVAGLTGVLETMDRVRRRLNPGLRLAGIVACRVNRTSHARAIVARLEERFPESFMTTTVRESIRLAEAPSFQLPITLFAPRSTGAEDHRALARELMVGSPAPTARPSVAIAIGSVTGDPASARHSRLARIASAVSEGLGRSGGADVGGRKPKVANSVDEASGARADVTGGARMHHKAGAADDPVL